MKYHEYGTIEYFRECFSDVMSDLPPAKEDINAFDQAMIMMKAFEDAIESWLDYHKEAVTSFEYLRDEFLAQRNEQQWLDDEDEAAKLPEIPEFPSLLAKDLL
tara:strand:+ start:227 stop:535 length:309 start_codon:yes stop_codon:yes gene_type:complete